MRIRPFIAVAIAVLAPGASSFLVLHPLKPGSYRFIDEFHAATGSMQLIAK